MPSELSDLFTLNVVAPHLKKFRPPTGAHDPRGDWMMRYVVYTLGSIRGHGGSVGSLELRRRAASGGPTAKLSVDYQKRVPPGMIHKVTAEITFREDALATPERWTYAAEIAGPEGSPLKHTRLEKSATAAGEAIEISDGEHRRRLGVTPPYAISWALFEAVGRLPQQRFEPLSFTLLDDFDQVKPRQTLSFRQNADVLFGERTVRLTAYDHLGEGIVPWIYWVDEAGRLLFAVSGLEAYLAEVH